MDRMNGGRALHRLAHANLGRAKLALLLCALAVTSCGTEIERGAERDNRRAGEDVRGVRDFLRDRGVTINTRLPDR